MDIIKHLRELRARATQGEWKHVFEGVNDSHVHATGPSGDDLYLFQVSSPFYTGRHDGALLVAAVNHLDLLLDVAENGDRVARAADMASDLDLQSEIHGLVTSVRALREASVK